MTPSLRRLHLLTLSAVALASLAACGGGGGASTGAAAPVATPAPVPAPVPAPAPGTVLFGNVAMSMAGEAACGFEAVNVTVTKLRFHMSATALAGDPGWTEIALQPARRINIAQLHNGAIQDLGSAVLTPGRYAQSRLVLDPNSNNDTTNSVVVAGAVTEVPLRTQAVAAEGIAVGPAFDLQNGQKLALVASFDACRSVLPNNGQFLLRPVIEALPTVKNGIVGYVEPGLSGSNVRVTAQRNGVVVRATIPDPATGQFHLSRLIPGSYDIVVTANGRAASVIAAVPVTSELSTTPLNTAATPIALQASATGYISTALWLVPASTVETPFGSAMQSFVSGPLVTIGYRMSDLVTGAVRFTRLPLAAPQLALYSATTALAFTARPDVAPAVASYSIASSAPGRATVQPISMVARPE